VVAAAAVGARPRRRIPPERLRALEERDEPQRTTIVAYTYPPLGLLLVGVGIAAVFRGRGWFSLVVIAFGVFFLWLGVDAYRSRRR